jgi:hypothetical protein
MIYILSGSFELILSFQEYRVVSQPSIMSFERSPYYIEFSFIRPEGWSPRVEKENICTIHRVNPRNPTYGLIFWVQRINSKLLIYLNSSYA